jgi:LacI family transcriptional regulator
MASNRQTPNMSVIADALGVSAATVSNALSGKGRVSPELIERVRAKAEELGYVPSVTARALRTGRSGVIGLVLPNISNPLFPQIAQAIENAAADAGYGVLIADSSGDNAKQTLAIQRLIERQVDGIVIVPRLGTRIAELACPVAVIDSPSTPNNTVSADHWQGGQLVAEHLVDLGHRDFVLIGANPLSNVQNDRIGGMKSRIPKDGRVDVIWIERNEMVLGAGCPLGLKEKVENGFTAFAASSDLHALRALTELQRAGIRVPNEASVVGFDDLVWSSVVSPSITTVRQDAVAIADIAIGALLATIEREPSPEASNIAVAQCNRVPMALVPRQTTARLATADPSASDNSSFANSSSSPPERNAP